MMSWADNLWIVLLHIWVFPQSRNVTKRRARILKSGGSDLVTFLIV